jgi:hypothetical protein
MTTAAARKSKSPPIPSRTLKDAVEDVKKLYKTYTHGSFSKAELASTLGVSATSGPFAGKYFTLREYGLLEGTGDNLKVSKSFIDINRAQSGSPAFKHAALEAIKRSDVFTELLTEWKTKLPPKEAVANRLEHQKRFNPNRARAAATVLEESLRFAGVLDVSNNILPIREGPAGAERDRLDLGGAERHEEEGLDDGGERPSLRTEIPLGDGRRVVVSYPSDLTGQEAAKVGNVLKAIVG